MLKKKICVVGLGYIGLPTSALLATNGYDVAGVDLNHEVVNTINKGKIHIVEPDLDAFVRSAVSLGKLRAFTSPQIADIYIICVPTPFHSGEGIPQPNINYVISAAKSISGMLKEGDIVVLESTSPVGTTRRISEIFRNEGVETGKIHIAYCPERVLPGKIMTELVENDRVIGGLTPEATEQASAFYKTFVKGAVLETDAATAEMCKLAENSYRDVNIAFANELSLICSNAGIDVWKLIELANHHPRVDILQPGTGVGGHCIAVDPWFIVASDPDNAKIIRTAREVNNRKTEWVMSKIKGAASEVTPKNGQSPKIACLGLAFKPDIDDLRESPAMQIALNLKALGFDIIAVEPNIQSHPILELAGIEVAIESADVVAILVKHREFIHAATRGAMKGLILDFCGVGEH
jgi:UDP-N-acetyl-D-mannosaminuronic acid dehydrogenase